MWLLSLLLSIVLYILVTTLGVALVVPFVGIVVRYRVNYNPKGFSLGPRIGADDDASAAQVEDGRVVGPRVAGLLAMFLRVRRLEGWRGLWKGFSEWHEVVLGEHALTVGQ